MPTGKVTFRVTHKLPTPLCPLPQRIHRFEVYSMITLPRRRSASDIAVLRNANILRAWRTKSDKIRPILPCEKIVELRLRKATMRLAPRWNFQGKFVT